MVNKYNHMLVRNNVREMKLKDVINNEKEEGHII
jgi:hypothetical protein